MPPMMPTVFILRIAHGLYDSLPANINGAPAVRDYRSRMRELWKVLVDLFSIQQADKNQGIVFERKTYAVITNSKSKVILGAFEFFETWMSVKEFAFSTPSMASLTRLSKRLSLTLFRSLAT